MAEYLILYDEDNPARNTNLGLASGQIDSGLATFSSIGQPTLLNNSWFATVDLTFECSKPFTFLNRETVSLRRRRYNWQANRRKCEGVTLRLQSTFSWSQIKPAKHVGVVVNSSGIFAIGEDRSEFKTPS
ncbi:MAG: tail protein (endogenous virus) [Lactobacillus phage ViSo-2018b]|nr:MAG: tail protein [Lactobacillus phage ViSo-2018b]